MKEENKHILLICIEFVQPLFSGNGILTQGLVRGLLTHPRQTQTYHITVVCARPESKRGDPAEFFPSNDMTTDDGDGDGNGNGDPFASAIEDGRLNIIVCDVPDHKWRKLDRSSCWSDILHKAPSMLQSHCRDLNVDCSYSYIFAIDWSALPTAYKFQELMTQMQLFKSSPSSATKLVYFVFRVFSASKELCQSQEDYEFYKNNELSGMKAADLTILLSHVDKKALESELQLDLCAHNCNQNTHILVPPLRHDIHCQATATSKRSLSSGGDDDDELYAGCSNENDDKPRFILCNARLSPEKNALRFAQIMNILHKKKILQKLNLQPLLIGAICDKEYADKVYSLLPSDSIIENRFMASHEMSRYLQKTVLNIHPSIYDAYGMTVAEAAAFGVPSIIHKECIGASSLLREEYGEILFDDMISDAEISSRRIQFVLCEDREKLREVGKNARRRALSWSINDYAGMLHTKL